MLFNFAMKRIKSPVTDWMHQIEKAENIFWQKVLLLLLLQITEKLFNHKL